MSMTLMTAFVIAALFHGDFDTTRSLQHLLSLLRPPMIMATTDVNTDDDDDFSVV